MSGAEYPAADRIVDPIELLRWVAAARAEIAQLRAQLREAEERGFRRGASACAAYAARVEAEAEAEIYPWRPRSDDVRGQLHGAHRMAQRIRQGCEAKAKGADR